MSGIWPCIGETGIYFRLLRDLGNTWNTFMCSFHVSGTMHFDNPRSASVTILLEISMLFSIVHKDHIRSKITFFFCDRFRDLFTLGFTNQIKIKPYPVSEGFQGPMKTISFLFHIGRAISWKEIGPLKLLPHLLKIFFLMCSTH